ncbi:MAG: TolC family protein [Deferribacteres bacterium]|nr:TolC family protein [candidate division KSB1 bacterium]MCB9500701.1 TolC family protein [Deferribacteres bacterium]
MRTMLLILFFYVTTAHANEGKENFLTVKDALEFARRNNPEINQLRELIEEKKGEKWSSTGLSDLNFSVMREGIDLGTNAGFDEKRWTLSQSIDFPLVTYFQRQRINAERQALESKYDAELLELKKEIKSIYTELTYAREILHLRTQQLQLAEQLHNSTSVRFELGEASELDLMKTDIERAEAQNELEDARNAFHMARYGLFRSIGLDPDKQKYSIQFPDTLVYLPVVINQYEVLNSLENQPDYVANVKLQQAAAKQVKAAWSSFLPQIDFSYYWQNLGYNFDNYGYEVGFSIPLWFPFNQRGHIQTYKAVHRRTVWQKHSITLEMKKQIELAWHGFDHSKQIVERVHNLVRVKSRKLLELTFQGYEAGEIDLLSLLDVQRTYLNTEKRYWDALKDYYLRVIELEKFTNREFVLKTNE